MNTTPLWISNRLRLGNNGSSAGVVIAVAGVALALMVMEFTLAIVVGFKSGIEQKLKGFDAQITVYGAYDPYTATGSPTVRLNPELRDVIDSVLPRADIRLAIRQPGIIKTDTDFEGLIFIGQNPDADFSFERSNVTEGTWPDYMQDSCRNMIVISEPTAKALGLSVGSRIYSTFVVDGAMKMRRYTVAALYRSNFGEYDRTVAYASLQSLQSVAAIDSLSGSRIDIRGIHPGDVVASSTRLQQALIDATAAGRLNEYYPVENITQSGAVYLNWLSLLDTNVTVIFVLMLCVGGFTLISSLFIIILDRIPLIGVLRALGAGRPFIRSVFVDIGIRITGLGIVIGNVLGIGLLLIQKYTHAVPLNPEMYYLSAVPVEIRPWTFVALNVGVLAVAWLVLLLPATSAAHIDPSKTVKYE